MVWLFEHSNVKGFLTRPSVYSDEVPKTITMKHASLVSHTSMMGGRYYVEQQYVKILNRFFILDVMQGERLPPLAEIHTCIFPLFFDIDLKLDAAHLDGAIWELLVHHLQACLHRFFPKGESAGFRIVLSTKSEGASPCAVPALRWERMDEEPADYTPRMRGVPALTDLLLKGRGEEDDPKAIVVSQGEYQVAMGKQEVLSNHIVDLEGMAYRPAKRLWKHGVHLHVPDLHLSLREALLVRAGLAASLGRAPEEWIPLLGRALDRAGWEDILDEQVYSKRANGGGLRVIGAPKAKRCCAGCPACAPYGGFAVDPSFYWPSQAYSGWAGADEGAEPIFPPRLDEATLRSLNRGGEGGVILALKLTTVRTSADQIHPGFVEYQGCPVLPADSVFFRGPAAAPASEGKKRLALSKHEKEALRLKDNRGMASSRAASESVVVTDPAVRRTVLAILVEFSPHYRNVTTQIRLINNERYYVVLRDEGSRYCLNKGGFHNSSTAYLSIRKDARGRFTYEAVMKCHCKKLDWRAPEDGGMGYTCTNFFLPRGLTTERRDVLFATSVGDASSNLKRKQQEVLEARQRAEGKYRPKQVP